MKPRPDTAYRALLSICTADLDILEAQFSFTEQADRFLQERVGAIVGFFSLFFEWKTPHGWDWFYLFLVAVFSQLGQIFLTNALQRERVAGVAIVNYTGLVYALLIGSFAFGETQSAESMSGMLLVVFGVLLSVIYSKRMRDLEKIEATVG